MNSGAGHDSGILADAGIPCEVVFLRHGNEGISHNPAETLSCNGDDPFMPGGDFSKLVNLFAKAALIPVKGRHCKKSFGENIILNGGKKVERSPGL